MHEFALTKSMLELVLAEANKAGAKRVGRINLVIGELSGFVDRCVDTYFDSMSKGTIAEHAQLCFKTVPTTGRCRDCKEQLTLKETNWTCPACKSNNIQLIGGNELFVESIEVD